MSTCLTSASTAATGDVARFADHLLRSLVCAALALTALTAAMAQAPAPSSPAALPSLSELAPAPFALPGSTQSLQKQIVNLLRKLEPVQSAEVLITAQEPEGSTLRVIVKTRANRRLSPEIITTMSEMLTGVVPGIAPDHVTIADSTGRLLYDRGQVTTPPPAQPLAAYPWAWLLLAAVAAMAVAWTTTRGLRGRTNAPAGAERLWLERVDQRVVAQILARERPEVAALVLSRMPEPGERRLRRLLKREGMVPPVAVGTPHPQVFRLSCDTSRLLCR